MSAGGFCEKYRQKIIEKARKIWGWKIWLENIWKLDKNAMTDRQSTFSQQLRATVIRNLRLKIRDTLKTTAEIFLPFYTLGTLIVLKILIPNPNFPAILEPHGSGRVFEHFNVLKNHTIAVVQHGNGSRHHVNAVSWKFSSCFSFEGIFCENPARVTSQQGNFMVFCAKVECEILEGKIGMDGIGKILRYIREDKIF